MFSKRKFTGAVYQYHTATQLFLQCFGDFYIKPSPEHPPDQPSTCIASSCKRMYLERTKQIPTSHRPVALSSAFPIFCWFSYFSTSNINYLLSPSHSLSGIHPGTNQSLLHSVCTPQEFGVWPYIEVSASPCESIEEPEIKKAKRETGKYRELKAAGMFEEYLALLQHHWPEDLKVS